MTSSIWRVHPLLLAAIAVVAVVIIGATSASPLSEAIIDYEVDGSSGDVNDVVEIETGIAEEDDAGDDSIVISGGSDTLPSMPMSMERKGHISLVTSSSAKCGVRRIDYANTQATNALDSAIDDEQEQEQEQEGDDEQTGEEDGLFSEDADDTDDLIMGGSITTAEQFPWQASLRFGKLHFCGGSLIDNRHILTASHCFRELSRMLNKVRVYFGKSLKAPDEKGEVIRKVVKYFQHPQFDKPTRTNNDIAILRLDRPVTFTDKIRPICLPSLKAEINNNAVCFVSGFGETNGTGGDDNFKAAEIPYIPKDKCLRLQPYIKSRVTNQMICLGILEGGTDSCAGDSGGPLVCADSSNTFIQYGIVSFGWKCGLKGHPGVYTKVSNFIPWIKTVIRRP